MAYETDKRSQPIPEKSTSLLSFTVKDEEGNAIAGSSLTTLTVKLYNDRNKNPINGRDGTDILGVNGGSVDANGLGVWKMEELDNQIMQDGPTTEDHTALFKWTYNTGGGTPPTVDTGYHQVRLRVKNLAKVS